MTVFLSSHAISGALRGDGPLALLLQLCATEASSLDHIWRWPCGWRVWWAGGPWWRRCHDSHNDWVRQDDAASGSGDVGGGCGRHRRCRLLIIRQQWSSRLCRCRQPCSDRAADGSGGRSGDYALRSCTDAARLCHIPNGGGAVGAFEGAHCPAAQGRKYGDRGRPGAAGLTCQHAADAFWGGCHRGLRIGHVWQYAAGL